MKEPIGEAKVSDIFEMSDTYIYGSALFLKLKATSLSPLRQAPRKK